jgi:hypothetical protein
VEGHPDIRTGPDVLVVFGRPRGDRGSYRQWEEDNVPLTVVFEILSPSNTVREMAGKLTFYDEHGVEEYYQYDPDHNHLVVYRRGVEALRRDWKVNGYVSPRLGIRFDLSGPEMKVFYPDGRPFLTFEEIAAGRTQAEQRVSTAEQRATTAEQRATTAEQRATTAEQRSARQADPSRKARRGQISPKELQELERLEDQAAPPGTPPGPTTP